MQVNIATWITRNASLYRDKLALQDDRHAWSYTTFSHRMTQLASFLKEKGVRQGERVAVLLPNCAEMIEILFACAQLGAIYVPLNWRLGEDELAYILGDCTPACLVYAARWEDRTQRLAGRQETAPVLVDIAESLEGSSYEAALQHEGGAPAGEPVGGGDDDLMIIYTSGTTGNPKGVVLTHNNVFWQTVNGWSLGVSPDTVCLVLLPLFHVGGLNGSVTPMLHVGATVILQQKFDAGAVLASIEKDHVTGVVGVPTIFRMLADHANFEQTDFSKCQVLLSGGAPLPESLIQLYHKHGLEFRQGYGLTEAAPGVTGMGPGECLRKAGSAGRQILYTEVRIVDNDGNSLPTGESGEIIVRGPNVMKGYWNLPEETAKTIRNGWLHTGDVGRFDEDGFLYIVDRKKDMIISGGENIYPAEIEKILAGHPKVLMATVVGQSDERWGEVPVAVVVPREEGLTSEDLHTFLDVRLARYKLPKHYHIVKDLPLNASGKVIKAEVKKRLGIA
ncbi:MAG: o-succinylbenzoate--CoA ligase [Myxococcales bacterium]|nr:o-succinylbenzoate--CoA ligase [Myxococcales bacterium]